MGFRNRHIQKNIKAGGHSLGVTVAPYKEDRLQAFRGAS